jgi:hypothetical protein
VPQREFTASIRMHFFDYFSDSEEKKVEYMKRWKEFYKAKGGFDYFGIDMDDPKIAFGYLKIGQIYNIVENGNVIHIPIEMSDLCAFRDKLVKTKVIDWEIK